MNQLAVLAFITVASIGAIAVGACLGALQDINELRKEVYKAHAEAGKWKALYEKQKASHTLDEEDLSLAEKQVKTLERRLLAHHGDHTQEALNAYKEIIQHIRMTG